MGSHPYRKTLALDNGVEFAKHESLERSLGNSIYFARPYHSNAHAINENTNGLLRQYFPKGAMFMTLIHQEVAKAVFSINDRPRKRLYYLTSRRYFLLPRLRFRLESTLRLVGSEYHLEVILQRDQTPIGTWTLHIIEKDL